MSFPQFPLLDIALFLDNALEADYLDLIGEFRAWVRQQRDSATQTLRDRV